MWELDCKEGWAPKNWYFWTVVLEKALESPLDCKEIKPVHLKGNQSWILIGMTDGEVEAPMLWPPNVKSRLIGKDSDAGKDWGQEETGATDDEIVGWHHQLSLSVVSDSATSWTATHQASLLIVNSWNLPKPTSIKLVMSSNHLILCRPLLLRPSIIPSIRVFSNE